MVVESYAQVINAEIPISGTYNNWTGLSKSVSLDNTTQPKGSATSTFKVTYNKKTKKYSYVRPYFLTAHNYNLNIPSNAYIKSVKFIARMKCSKGMDMVAPRGRLEIRGRVVDIKDNGSGKTGWHDGNYDVYPTTKLTTSFKDYTYTMSESVWKKSGYTYNDLNKDYNGIDLIFNHINPKKSGTVYVKWVKIVVDYIVPKYTLEITPVTTKNSPYTVDTGNPFNVKIKAKNITKATDSNRTVNVKLPFGMMVNSYSGAYGGITDNIVKFNVDGGANKTSTLTLNVTDYAVGSQNIVASNSNVGSSIFYYYGYPSDPNDGYYDIALSHDGLIYGQTACIKVKAHLIDLNGTVQFKLFEKHNSKTYITPKSVQLLYSSISNTTISRNGQIITLTVPSSTDANVEFKVCYSSPLATGEGELGLTVVDTNTDFSIPINVATGREYHVTNNPSDSSKFNIQLNSDIIDCHSRRVASTTELNAIILPYGFSDYDDTMIMSSCNVRMDYQEDVDYIGMIPLKYTHYNPTNKTKNKLLNKSYKNKTYMGKEGVIDEDIDLNIKVTPQQATTLQGLVKLDKPTPINTCHKLFEGDTLAHRGWAELHGVTIKKINPNVYDAKCDVTYITHDIHTKYNIARKNRILNVGIPQLYGSVVDGSESLSDTDYFDITTDGTFMYEEEVEDNLCNLFTLTNGQSFSIKSHDAIGQASEFSFKWACNKLTEDKENMVNREFRLIDTDGNVVANLIYYDFDFTNDDYITCQLLLEWENVHGGTSQRTDEIVLRSEVDVDEFEDDDEAVSVSDIIDNDVTLDDLFGSTIHFRVNNGNLTVIDEGFNGMEFIQSDIEIPTKPLHFEALWTNNNSESDDTEIECFVSIDVMETILDTKYSEYYSKQVVAPFPVADHKILYTREGEEGTLYYYLDDGTNFKYIIEPYYQYSNGVDLRSDTGISLFDLDNGYTRYYIQNGLIGLGFNKLNGDMYLQKYDLESKRYVTTHYLNLGTDVKFEIPYVDDDIISLMANDSVFTIWRGHPYIMVNHKNMDIKLLSRFNKVWGESVGGASEEYPVMFDLLNTENQLPPSIGGNKTLDSDALTLQDDLEVELTEPTIDVTVPNNITADTDATFTFSMNPSNLITNVGVQIYVDGVYVSSTTNTTKSLQFNAGEHTIQAVFVGNGSYAPAWSTVKSFIAYQKTLPQTTEGTGEWKLVSIKPTSTTFTYKGGETLKFRLTRGSTPATKGTIIEVSKPNNSVVTMQCDANGYVTLKNDDWKPDTYTIRARFYDYTVTNGKVLTQASRKITVQKATPTITFNPSTATSDGHSRFYCRGVNGELLRNYKCTAWINGKKFSTKLTHNGNLGFNLKKKGTYKFKITLNATDYYKSASLTKTETKS